MIVGVVTAVRCEGKDVLDNCLGVSQISIRIEVPGILFQSKF